MNYVEQLCRYWFGYVLRHKAQVITRISVYHWVWETSNESLRSRKLIDSSKVEVCHIGEKTL
jgi:hypothetical protein